MKTIMQLARHGSAQMSMEVYAKPKPERLRAAVEAVSEGVERAIPEAPWCARGARAVGAEGDEAVSPVPGEPCLAAGVVTPTGFEPVLRG